jgi:hypothetical protein
VGARSGKALSTTTDSNARLGSTVIWHDFSLWLGNLNLPRDFDYPAVDSKSGNFRTLTNTRVRATGNRK